MLAAQKVGGHKMAVLYCAENPACKQTVAPLQAAGKQFRIPVVFNAPVLTSAPNYTAQCLAAKEAGADVMFIADGPAPITIAVAAQLRPAGLHAPPGLRRSGLLAADGRQAGLGRVPRHPGQHPVLRDQHARFEGHARRLCAVRAVRACQPAVQRRGAILWTTGLLIAGRRRRRAGRERPTR